MRRCAHIEAELGMGLFGVSRLRPLYFCTFSWLGKIRGRDFNLNVLRNGTVTQLELLRWCTVSAGDSGKEREERDAVGLGLVGSDAWTVQHANALLYRHLTLSNEDDYTSKGCDCEESNGGDVHRGAIILYLSYYKSAINI